MFCDIPCFIELLIGFMIPPLCPLVYPFVHQPILVGSICDMTPQNLQGIILWCFSTAQGVEKNIYKVGRGLTSTNGLNIMSKEDD